MAKADEDKVEPATIADLLARPSAERTLVVSVGPGKRRSLTLRAVSRPTFDALVDAHPPRDDDRDEFGMPKRWNPDSFWPALVAASLADPVLSEAEVVQVWAAWSKADTERLAKVAYDLNEGETEVIELGKSLAVSAATTDSED